MIRSRDDESSNPAGSDTMPALSTDTGSSNNVTPIIIGVVVGGVAAIASKTPIERLNFPKDVLVLTQV
ncbi:uncharacterized protein ACLA_047780 [Aspergillus clavatus NRRL 1]|uniref:Uncharacterized protein n=1 Tax=Aspergillus clavatus (strain ATCC 1007 / CBS 513.65 / DSM 816 / NCTC 3887 / NRRL 1 / QM 1276 / 107) TaxID=344612 RepID=A1CHF4_ASPCL|nr:uncharacterized protein ACLA_047780 [Aspergillus clavatus NRRL 1]EAW10309.1 hypothetical protein ACLA_047780 [Aspergillus clavatus NRRL 1]